MKYNSFSTTDLGTYYLSKILLPSCQIDIHQRNASCKEFPWSRELEKVHGQTRALTISGKCCTMDRTYFPNVVAMHQRIAILEG